MSNKYLCLKDIAAVHSAKMDYYYIQGTGWTKRIWFKITLAANGQRTFVPFYQLNHSTYTKSVMFQILYSKYGCVSFEDLKDRGMIASEYICIYDYIIIYLYIYI